MTQFDPNQLPLLAVLDPKKWIKHFGGGKRRTAVRKEGRKEGRKVEVYKAAME